MNSFPDVNEYIFQPAIDTDQMTTIDYNWPDDDYSVLIFLVDRSSACKCHSVSSLFRHLLSVKTSIWFGLLAETDPFPWMPVQKSWCLQNQHDPLTVFVDPIHDVLGEGNWPKNFQHGLRCCRVLPNWRRPHLQELTSLQSKTLTFLCNMGSILPLLLLLCPCYLEAICQSPHQSQAHRQGVVQNLKNHALKIL